ncbi:P2Y purinoceptor 2 [Biomphalaria glabrata]|nr:P2Y purinoceptor 2-like [Biomphalaria glabrata]
MSNSSSVNSLTWSAILPDEFIVYFAFWFGVVASNCLTALGMLSNLINITVFVKLGLKERVNFTLFWLSTTDLVLAVFHAAMTRGFIGDAELGPISVDGTAFINFLWIIKALCKDLSSGLTMFISIERCLCVIRPIHFHSSFIARHGKLIVTVILVFFITYYSPLVFSFSFVKDTNSTLFYETWTDFYIEYDRFNYYFLGFFLCVFAPFLVLVCSVLMFRGLQQSSRVRRALAIEHQIDHSHSGSVMTTKERRVVKMVFVLAILYMITSFPLIAALVIYDYFDTFYSEANLIETRNLILLTEMVTFYIGTSYGSFSILVYYYFNANFRTQFRIIFSFTLFKMRQEKSLCTDRSVT